ncbi:MAG: hypothetical protein ACR2PZ_11790 [Pseudomonadales bacterium]
MQEHYARMLTYSPYFDSRLLWFPKAWAYLNAYAIKPRTGLQRSKPEWILKDSSGNDLYIPYDCQDGKCPQFAADLSNSGFRQHRLNQAAALLQAGYRGLYIDDVNLAWRVSNGVGEIIQPIDRSSGQPMTLASYRRNMVEFLELARTTFPDAELVHNMIWYATEFDDPLLHRQIRAADYLALQRGVSDRGIKSRDGSYGFNRFLALVDLVHALDRAIILDDDDQNNQSPANRDYELAFYFLVNQGRDLLGADGERARMSPERFYPGYLVDLGEVLSERYLTRDGLYRRDYSNGFVLVNPPGSGSPCVNFTRPSFSVLGERQRRLCLPSPGGAVLLWARPTG